MSTPTNTHGGGIDQTAVIGHAPESRNWVPGMPTYGVALGEGVRVEAFVTIDAGMTRPTVLGARSWCLKRAHLGHDVEVGEDCEISTGAIIGGHCEIGNGVRIGIGAVLRPFVKVGDGARIGCGAVVVKDVPAGEVWAGNPAKRIGPKCSKCNGSGWVHFMNMHPEDYEPPVRCSVCNVDQRRQRVPCTGASGTFCPFPQLCRGQCHG